MTAFDSREFRILVSLAARDRVVQWLLDQGAGGVQEDWPGLDQSGPVISGDPAEWSGEALVSPPGRILLRAWLPAGLETPLRAMLPNGAELDVRPCEEVDWATAWREAWEPIEVGRRLVICPPWKVPHGTDRLPVLITPGQASGTGVHPTTRACLELIENVVHSGDRVLDVGTGSGILAIAAIRLGAGSAVGIDTDPVALPEAESNAAANGVEGRLRFLFGGLDARLGQFEGVVANLTGNMLVRIAGELAAAALPGGFVIVSGFLETDADVVTTALVKAGFNEERRLTAEGWVAIRLMRI